MPRVWPAVLMAAAAAFPALAADWGQLATISSTLGVNANRLCLGEGLRSDIGCPSYAPYVDPTNGYFGVGTVTPAAPFEVSGSILLRGINSGVAPSPVAAVEFFTGRNSTGGLNVGQTRGDLAFSYGGSYGGYRHFIATKHNSVVGNGNGIEFYLNTGASAATSSAPGTGNLRVMGIYGSGNVGISTTNPNAKLEVNGDISATNLRLSGNLYVSGSQTFDGVTFTNGGVSATGIITATSFSGDGSRLTGLASGDRITSGTTSVIATQDRSVTITTAGSQRVVFGENGNVGIGTANPLTGLHVENPNYNGQLLITRGNGSGYYLTQSGNVGSIGAYGTTNQFSIFGSAFSVLSSGNIGIGTISPNAKLQVCEGLCVLAGTAGAGNIATFGRNGNAAITVSALSTNNSSIFFADQDDGDIGGITYYHSLDTLGFRTNNGDRMVLNGDGLGIGTTNPQATLQVSGSFTVSTSAQTTTPSLYVGTNGNVGIGTVSPGRSLEIAKGGGSYLRLRDANGSSYWDIGGAFNYSDSDLVFSSGSSERFRINSTGKFAIGYSGANVGGSGSGLIVNGNVGIGTTAPSATLHVSGTARVTSWTTIAANVTPTTELDVYGTISATNILVNGAPITGNADRITSGTTSAIAYNGGSITFTTANSQRMIIGDTGNVGIGTTNTVSALTVGGANPRILVSSTASGAVTTGINFSDNGGVGSIASSWWVGPGMVFTAPRDIAGRGFAFNSNAGATRMFIDANNGNVGIATTSPGKTLEVSGTAQIVSRTLVGGAGTPSATLQVSGSLLLAGNDNIPCTASVLGLVRRNPTTGRMQACR